MWTGLKDRSIWTLCAVSSLDLILQLLSFIVLLYLYGVGTSASPWHVDKCEVCLSVAEQGLYLKESIWILPKMACCCTIRPILNPWFNSVTSKLPVECKNKICLLDHWRASLNWPQYQSGLLTSPWLRIIAIKTLGCVWGKFSFEPSMRFSKNIACLSEMLEITPQGVCSFTRE